MRQGQDRLGQDARLRPAAPRRRVKPAEPRQPRALVLVPTRELATQVRDELEPLGAVRDVNVAAIYGGADIEKQIRQLARASRSSSPRPAG